MVYIEELAEWVIKHYGLGRTAKYRWELLGAIPDKYFQADFVNPKSLSEAHRQQQENIISVISHPIILHSAFYNSVAFNAKLDEVLSLRRGKVTNRQRKGRPNLPALNFSPSELIAIIDQLRALALVMNEQLSLANGQPYERRQQTLKELLRSRKELTVRQTVMDLEEQAATRWINFVRNSRGPLNPTDRYIIAHVFSQLQDLLALINSTIDPAK